MTAIENNAWAYRYCSEKMQRDLDVINLANKKLEKCNKSVDNYLCDKLIRGCIALIS